MKQWGSFWFGGENKGKICFDDLNEVLLIKMSSKQNKKEE